MITASVMKGLKLNIFMSVLLSKSYFVEHFFRGTNSLGFHYFVYGGCHNYRIITVPNNYHMLHANILQKKLKVASLDQKFTCFT